MEEVENKINDKYDIIAPKELDCKDQITTLRNIE